jgi:hypothetical protein
LVPFADERAAQRPMRKRLPDNRACWIEPRHIATVRHFRRRRRAISARRLLEALAVAD